MPRTKATNNPFGSILPEKTTTHTKRSPVTVYAKGNHYAPQILNPTEYLSGIIFTPIE